MSVINSTINVPDDPDEKAEAIAAMEAQGWTYVGESQHLKETVIWNETVNVVTWDLLFEREA